MTEIAISTSFLKQNLAQALKGCLGIIPHRSDGGFKSFEVDGKYYLLEGVGYDSYFKTINRILEDKTVAANYKQKEIEDRVFESLKSLIRDSNGEFSMMSVQKAATDLIQDIKKEIIDWKVIFPIEGLVLEQKVNFGPTTIYPAGANFAHWKMRARESLSRIKDPPAREKWRGLAFEQLEALSKQAYALVNIRCRDKRTREIGSREAEMAINALRYLQVEFGLQRAGVTSFGITAHPGKRQFFFPFRDDFWPIAPGFRHIGPFVEQTFQREALRKMKRSRAYQRLRELIAQTNRKDMETRILSAIMWYGEASVQPVPSIRFLDYIVAIEVLLSHKKDVHEGRITANISERLGFILSHRKNIRARADMIAKMSSLYALRSDIVHNGIRDVPDEFMQYGKEFAFYSIRQLLKMPSIETAQDLDNWVELRKLKY